MWPVIPLCFVGPVLALPDAFADQHAAQAAPSKRRKSPPRKRRPSPPAARRAAPRPGRRAWERHRETAGRQLGGHGPDAAAVALLVVAALTTLGLASDSAGAVGSGLADAFGAIFGLARFAVPVVCVVVAVLCFRAGPRHPPCREAT